MAQVFNVYPVVTLLIMFQEEARERCLMPCPGAQLDAIWDTNQFVMTIFHFYTRVCRQISIELSVSSLEDDDDDDSSFGNTQTIIIVAVFATTTVFLAIVVVMLCLVKRRNNR